jgi:alpha-tubulin suppressor-like RCC1 family protein
VRTRLIPVGVALALLLACVTVLASCGQLLATAAPSAKLGSHGWAAVACGSDHTVALRKDGTLWAWGGNDAGQLGLGNTTTRLTPTRVGNATGWASVSCGDGDTLAVRTNGTLWAWGFNGNGELGLGDTKERLTPAEVGGGAP